MEFDQNRFITVTIMFDHGRGSIYTGRDVYAFTERGIEYTDECFHRCHSKYCSYRSSTLMEYQGKTYPITKETMEKYFQEWISEKYDNEDYIELDDLLL